MWRSNASGERKLRSPRRLKFAVRGDDPEGKAGPRPMPLPEPPKTDAAWAALLGPAVDVATAGIIIVDTTGTVRASNVAARRIFGLTERERDPLVGRRADDRSFRPRHAD